jgi:hypothetical protein
VAAFPRKRRRRRRRRRRYIDSRKQFSQQNVFSFICTHTLARICVL